MISKSRNLLVEGGSTFAGREALFFRLDTGFLELLPLTTADTKPIAAVLKKYRDTRIQFADAALVHLAARDGLDTIFTLDQRDFSVYRLPRGKAVRILPGCD